MKKNKKNTDSKGRFLGETPAGKRILSSLHDLVDTLEAGIPPGRKNIPCTPSKSPEPGKYGPKQVKALRHRLNPSARPLFRRGSSSGASTILVQKWEARRSSPRRA